TSQNECDGARSHECDCRAGKWLAAGRTRRWTAGDSVAEIDFGDGRAGIVFAVSRLDVAQCDRAGRIAGAREKRLADFGEACRDLWHGAASTRGGERVAFLRREDCFD